MKWKGGVLPYVLGLSLIMSIICFMAITFFYYKQYFWIKTETEEKMHLNLEAAVQYSFAYQLDNLQLNSPLLFDLYNTGKDSVQITKNNWGLFDMLSVKAFSNNISSTKCLAVGSSNSYPGTSLYLSNELSLPLTLAGNTEIIGNTFLPSKGIKSGYINKIGFSGKFLFQGTSASSNYSIPEICSDINTKTTKIFSLLNIQHHENISELPTEITNSFKSAVKIFYSSGKININSTLKGNIMVISTNEILVHPDAIMNNVILVAPNIIIKSGVSAQIQAFASHNLTIDNHVTLRYPSNLVVLNQQSSKLNIKENTNINGTILLVDKPGKNPENDGILSIGQGTIIHGQVVSQGWVSHKGTVYGQIITNKFLVKSSSRNYSNYMLDAKIDITKLSDRFIFLNIFNTETSNRKTIMEMQ